MSKLTSTSKENYLHNSFWYDHMKYKIRKPDRKPDASPENVFPQKLSNLLFKADQDFFLVSVNALEIHPTFSKIFIKQNYWLFLHIARSNSHKIPVPLPYWSIYTVLNTIMEVYLDFKNWNSPRFNIKIIDGNQSTPS